MFLETVLREATGMRSVAVGRKKIFQKVKNRLVENNVIELQKRD